jgi:hypothetical protein
VLSHHTPFYLSFTLWLPLGWSSTYLLETLLEGIHLEYDLWFWKCQPSQDKNPGYLKAARSSIFLSRPNKYEYVKMWLGK